MKDFEDRYIEKLRENDEYILESEKYENDRYFTKLCDDINDVIEANDKLLAHLYTAKRSYMSVRVVTRGFFF